MNAMTKAIGRPSIRTPEIVEDILARIANGETLASISRIPGYPAPTTWYDWCDKDTDLSERFARARVRGFDAIAEETVAIADTPPAYSQTEGGMRIDTGDVAHRKLQIETRLKLLAKWDPKRYGEKVELQGSGKDGAVLVQVVTGVPDDDAAG